MSDTEELVPLIMDTIILSEEELCPLFEDAKDFVLEMRHNHIYNSDVIHKQCVKLGKFKVK